MTSLGVFQEMIEQYVHWNEDIGEWQLKCVAYTGNNMRKQTPQPEKDKEKQVCKQGTFHKYRRNVNVNPRGGGDTHGILTTQLEAFDMMYFT